MSDVELNSIRREAMATLRAMGYVKGRGGVAMVKGAPCEGWLAVHWQTSRERFGALRFFSVNLGVWPAGTVESHNRTLDFSEPETVLVRGPSHPGGAIGVWPQDVGLQAPWLSPGVPSELSLRESGRWWSVPPMGGSSDQSTLGEVEAYLRAADRKGEGLLSGRDYVEARRSRLASLSDIELILVSAAAEARVDDAAVRAELGVALDERCRHRDIRPLVRREMERLRSVLVHSTRTREC